MVFISIDADEFDKQETPKSDYSFKSIKKWIKDTYGVTVNNSSISMVKQKCGAETLERGASTVIPQVKTEKERLVLEAFKHLEIITNCNEE
uniref:hypothetical protein n=1 Tax=Acetatifactor sp. TaxID=1872090 RepID=UPI0040570311